MSSSLVSVSLNRFVFVLKAVAENDLWDEAVLKLEENGIYHIDLDLKAMQILQDLFREKVSAKEELTKRGHRASDCVCTSGHGGVVPPPSGSGGDGGTGPVQSV